MKRNNKVLYEKIMRNVSREVRRILNEEVQCFDTSDYDEDPDNIIDDHVIDDVINDPASKLINKVLVKKCYGKDLTREEHDLWNKKIAGKVINDEGTIALYIGGYKSFNYTASPVNINDIESYKGTYVKIKDKNGIISERRIVSMNTINNKQLIMDIMKVRKNTGKIGIYKFNWAGNHFLEAYYTCMIIDTDSQAVILDNTRTVYKLGFKRKDIQNGTVIIDKRMSTRINWIYLSDREFDFNADFPLGLNQI